MAAYRDGNRGELQSSHTGCVDLVIVTIVTAPGPGGATLLCPIPGDKSPPTRGFAFSNTASHPNTARRHIIYGMIIVGFRSFVFVSIPLHRTDSNYSTIIDLLIS